jgi:hypothetical protein
VKKFLLLHYGFEQPTPEVMEAWGKWLESIADVNLDQGGFAAGREICYNVIEAESLDDAERIAGENPFISSIRVYEIRGG